MYLIRHGTAEAHLSHSAYHDNPPLSKLGVRQAELTRDFLAVRPIDYCYCSPKLRALQTASIIAAPQGLTPVPMDSLVDCEMVPAGLNEPLHGFFPPHRFGRSLVLSGPGDFTSAETSSALRARVTSTLEELFMRHEGLAILVVAHNDVNRIYLADLMGMNPDQAGQVQLDNCGISVVVRDALETTVSTLNASFHLQGIAA